MPNSFPILVGAAAAASYTAKITGTGQTVSYADYDDAYENAGRETSFFILKENNPFGHKQRFTGITGGYYDQVAAAWKDKNGTATTLELAKPDNIILDWNTWEVPTGDVLGWHTIQQAAADWNAAVLNCHNFTVGAFTSGWRLPDIYTLTLNGCIDAFAHTYSHQPFATNGHPLWSSTTCVTPTSQAYRYEPAYGFILNTNKTTALFSLPVRTFNISELTF